MVNSNLHAYRYYICNFNRFYWASKTIETHQWNDAIGRVCCCCCTYMHIDAQSLNVPFIFSLDDAPFPSGLCDLAACVLVCAPHTHTRKQKHAQFAFAKWIVKLCVKPFFSLLEECARESKNGRWRILRRFVRQTAIAHCAHCAHMLTMIRATRAIIRNWMNFAPRPSLQM